MKTKKLLFVIICSGLLNIQSLFAQVTIGTDIFNRYVWRGLELGGNSPSLQPWLDLSWVSKNENHCISFGTWGAYTFSATANQETDLYLTYKFKKLFSFTLNDYFFPGLNAGAKNQYFVYSADSTGHVFEGVFSFNGTEKLPFSLLFAMNFYGNDARKINPADTTIGDIFMSKYLELSYTHSFKDFDFKAFVGMALDKPNLDLGETAFYLNEKPGIINLGIKASKKIEITEKFSLPVQLQVITNPELQKMYYLFGISL